MTKFLLTTVGLSLALGASGCSSGTSSSGGSGVDASDCIERTLNTIYTNDCSYAVNVLILRAGQKVFKVKGKDSSTRTSTSAGFGGCRTPSKPILNASNNGYTCS